MKLEAAAKLDASCDTLLEYKREKCGVQSSLTCKCCTAEVVSDADIVVSKIDLP